MLLTATAVLRAGLTATESLAALSTYSDRARVAVQHRIGPAVLWYLFTAGDVRAKISGAAATNRLSELLDLSHLTPIQTVQASEKPDDTLALPALVLDGDRVVGVLVADAVAAEEEERAWGGRQHIGFRGERTAAERPAFEVVRVFFGTDRQPHGDGRSDPYFVADRGDLTFGTADVSIPAQRKKGTLPRPSWWRFEFRENPARHVMITALQPLSRDAFVQDIRSTLQQATKKHALLFVHGYNVTFPDAVRRTAQLAYDLRTDDSLEFPGLPLLYSWPSQGAVLGYTTDETNIRWTQTHFEQFLRLALTETGAEVVHVIAHSMGNRALIECLNTLDTAMLPPGSAKLDQVVFAAPDYDAGTLEEMAARLATRATRLTLYASSGDLALRASREIRSGLRRAGESGDQLLVVNGIDTIDASSVDTSLLGHGYFGERTVLGDIFYLLKDRTPPGQRYGLTPRMRSDLRYWEFAP